MNSKKTFAHAEMMLFQQVSQHEQPMSSDLESALRDFFKPIIREAIKEVSSEWQFALPEASSDTTNSDRYLLRAREMAERLGISERKLFALTIEGILPCVRLGRLVRYNVETIERWIRENESSADLNPRPRRAIAEAKDREKRKSASVVSKPQRKKSVRTASTDDLWQSVSATQPKTSMSQKGSKKAEPEPEANSPNPFRTLLKEIGVDRDELGPLTNGEIMRIAEVDIATCHGWLYLGREMPEEALEKLRRYFRDLSKAQ